MAEWLLLFPLFVMAVVLHEVSHGWVALRFGDTTALNAGRLTLNPLKHVDLFGTVILPILLVALKAPFVFGWAKPVPINPLYMRHPKQNILWVGLAGPAANFILAGSVALALLFFGRWCSPIVAGFSKMFVLINLILGTFNLIPVPPLDGSRILVGLLPAAAAHQFLMLERWGILIVMILSYCGVIGRFMWPVVLFLYRGLGL